MAEGIHTLHDDIKSLINENESYKDRARRTALYLNLNEIGELISNENYEKALEKVKEEWEDNDYYKDMDDYVS